MSIESGRIYRIINASSGTALDVAHDKTTMHCWTRHDANNQQWLVETLGDGLFSIRSQSGPYLAHVGRAGDGVKVVGSEVLSAWKIRQDPSDGSMQKINAHSKDGKEYVLDLANHGNAAPGTPVQIWSSAGGRNQSWKFEQVGK